MAATWWASVSTVRLRMTTVRQLRGHKGLVWQKDSEA